ncbi:MAG: hydrogenase iron-sulfur subunit [Candidatus Helarchaeota archaeon]
MDFEPKILGFLCNWCSYAGADLAGVSRIQYPPALRVIRVMCSGRVEPEFVIRTLQRGVDGVIVMGCHLNDCHYIDGNFEALNKYNLLKKLLEPIGLANRIHLEWVSASEGVRFGQVISDFTAHIKSLGPSPLRNKEESKDLYNDLEAVAAVATNFRLRALVARERKITEEGNIYENVLDSDYYEAILEDALKSEFERSKILLTLQERPQSVKELAKELQIASNKVLKHIVVLRQKGQVALDRIEGVTPYYFGLYV